MTQLFAGSDDVAFMDVNLSQQPIREGPNGEAYNPGSGGWPTIRYFTRETGIAGGTYAKVTDMPMCTELGDVDRMTDYVEEYGKTARCSVATQKGCTEKESAYIGKMKPKPAEEVAAQLERLETMDGSTMTAELFRWVKQRKKILKQLVVAAAADDGDGDGSPGGSDEL